MKRVCLTVDGGTSSIRAGLWNENLEPVAALQHKRLLKGRFDADEEWRETCRLIESLCRENADCEIVSVAVTEYIAWVLVDENVTPLAPAYLYTSCPKQAAENLENLIEEKEYYTITARKASPEMGALLLMTVKSEQPDLYQKTGWLLTMKDYINYKLTGKVATDRVFAGYTFAFDIASGNWSLEMLAAMGLGAGKFPEAVASTDIVGYVADKQCGIKTGVPVAAGGPDGSFGILGAGGMEKGVFVSVMGTTDTNFAITEQFVTDDMSRSLITNIHPLGNMWLVGGPTGFSGGTADWLVRNFSGGKTIGEVEMLAAEVADYEELPVFTTGLTGERTPFWNPESGGSVAGLKQYHRIGHLLRSVMESNSFLARNMIERLKKLSINVKKIIATGGSSNSELWMNIKSNVCNLPLYVAKEDQSTMRGAAIVAMRCIDKNFVIKEAEMKKEILPNSVGMQSLHVRYGRYLRLIDMMSELYSE